MFVHELMQIVQLFPIPDKHSIIRWHTINGGLDSGLWTLDSGLWTLDSTLCMFCIEKCEGMGGWVGVRGVQ